MYVFHHLIKIIILIIGGDFTYFQMLFAMVITTSSIRLWT
jgi:hypothetical protein